MNLTSTCFLLSVTNTQTLTVMFTIMDTEATNIYFTEHQTTYAG